MSLFSEDIESKFTAYNNLLFRSRLEARWALIFDGLRVVYAYEPRAFQLANGLSYVPDFWLERERVWIEIKGKTPTSEEAQKAMSLFDITECPVYVFVDEPFVSGKPKRVYGVDVFAADGLGWHKVCDWIMCNDVLMKILGVQDQLKAHKISGKREAEAAFSCVVERAHRHDFHLRTSEEACMEYIALLKQRACHGWFTLNDMAGWRDEQDA